MTRIGVGVAFVVVSSFVLGACAKKREEDTPTAPASTAPQGIEPKSKCRYESVMATATLDISNIQALDLPADKVKESFSCSQGPLQECAGMAGKGEPFLGTLSYALTVDDKGFVTEVKVDGASEKPAPPAVSECTTQILKRLDFPGAPKEKTTVRVSLGYVKHQESPRFAGADVTASSQVVEGTVERANSVLDVSLGRLRGCYLLALERDATSDGTIDFTLSLGATGNAADVSLVQRGTLTKDAVACVDTVMRATTFPVKSPAKLKGTLTMHKRAP